MAREARERFAARKWSRQSVRRILKNPAYVGDVVWCRRPHDKLEREEHRVRNRDEWVIAADAHPHLVSRTLFSQVQERLKFNKKHTRTTRGGYFLSGLIRCAHCGERYVGAGGPKGPPGDPDRYRFYRDRGGVEPNVVCEGHLGTLQRRVVEPKVLEVIGEVVSHPAVQELISDELDRALGDIRGGQENLRSVLKAELTCFKDSRNRVVQAIGRGVLRDDDASEELEAIRQRKEQAEAAFEQLTFEKRRSEAAQGEKSRLLKLAADFPKLATRLKGSALRELIRPWLQDGVVDKVQRTLTLTIRRIPDAPPFLRLEPSPGRGSP